ncbi:MAG: hypothetical protein ACXQTW_06945 [Candidatus Methanospirareceae archaeon]
MKIKELLLMFFVSLVLFNLASIMITQACAVATAEVMNEFSHRQTPIVDDCVLFDTGVDRASYPSIPGEHKGNFTPRKDIKIKKVYTCPCPGTGGHSEFIEFFYPDGTSLGNASWNGYKGDWHNITFDEPIELEGNQTYNYILKTGSYPQIIHSDRVETPDGIITCYEFIDVNGRKHKNWIPAIKFFGETTEIQPDKTPPASVTDLNETKVGQNFIEWAWKNPEDPDFLKTMIYLNDEFLTNLSKTISKFNATNLTPDTEYKIGIKTVDKSGNINQSIVEDYARTLAKQNPGNKTWEEMNFSERKALVEEFLRVDPTPYAEINHCLYIADRLYKNATHAKELYGLPCNIPMCLDHRPYYGNGHIHNAVLLGNNKSNIEHWGFINKKDRIGIFDKNVTLLSKLDRTDFIWETGFWVIPNEKYRLMNYSTGFHAYGEAGQKPTVEVIPTYPIEYQDIIPA